MTALVTGASRGIGLSISEYLIEKGYEVIGIGRDFSNASQIVENPLFHKIILDLNDIPKSIDVIKKNNKEYEIDLLVNNAGTAYYGLHENISPMQIDEMVRINLTIPMIITSILIRNIKERQGTIINISSHTAHEINTHGCAYGASKAGLSSFGRSLFEEYRKKGIKVVNIEPDMTKTELYRHATFQASSREGASLFTKDIVSAVDYILNQPKEVAVNSISVTPQFRQIEKISNQDK